MDKNMKLLNQSKIFQQVIDVRCGSFENAEKLYEETRLFLESKINDFNLPSNLQKASIIKTIYNRVTNNIHSYNPKKNTYADWVNNVLDSYITYLLVNRGEDGRPGFINWKWELAYSEDREKPAKATGKLNPFNSVFIKELRKKFFEVLHKECDMPEIKALLLSFQNPPDIEYWSDILEIDELKFRSLYMNAVKKLKKAVFENKKDKFLHAAIRLLSEKLSYSIQISDEELNLLKDEERRKAISLSLKKETLSEAASTQQVNENVYRDLLFSSFVLLNEKLKGMREEKQTIKYTDVYQEHFNLDKALLLYRSNLMNYGLKHAIKKAPFLTRSEFHDYKGILNFIYLLFTAQSRPPSVTELLTFAINKNASDLHLTTDMPPLLRIDGDIYRINLPAYDRYTVRHLIESVMNKEQKETYKKEYEIDFSHQIRNKSRFRVNAFSHYRGPAAAFRVIPSKQIQLKEIGCANTLKKITDYPSGLILVTGPTGAGKSTTLSAMIDYKNKKDYMNILTIEDPVEYLHESKKCLVNQREVHNNTHSFNKALRSALREDPDIILLGEMRDLETIRLALTAAETGHLVFATLHTTGAPQSVDRIIDVFPASEKAMVRFMLSESLRAVISQTLIKKIGGGRIAALEIMITSPAIRNLIREEKVSQMYSAMQMGRAEGMQTLEQHLKMLVEEKIITPENAYAKALNKEALKI